MAAQALVRPSYSDPLETFERNIQGTANILEALRHCDSVKVALLVTTDKVYKDNEGEAAYTEEDPLGGHDPYSASKAASEIVIDSYKKSFLATQGVAVATARAGNVIGGGDWSQDRLIPDAVRAWQQNEPLEIRMPDAIRPWQHVLEPLFGYLSLSNKLYDSPNMAGAYNFGPSPENAVTVREVVEKARNSFDGADVNYGEPDKQLHEASYLLLDTSKVAKAISVSASLPVDETMSLTMEWYKAQLAGGNALQLCLDDICIYESKL
jgi:CDP-glucose 4,6-dehydratase